MRVGQPAHRQIVFKRPFNTFPLHGTSHSFFHSSDHDSTASSTHNDPSSYVPLLQKCGTLQALFHGMHLHTRIAALGIEQNPCIRSSLLHMYIDCGALVDARFLFDAMQNCTHFSWNIMMRLYLRSGQEGEVFRLFEEMHTQGMIPDTFIFVSMFSACSGEAEIIIGMHLHAYAVSAGVEAHLVVATSLVNMYGKYGMVADAEKQFYTMPMRNIASWNTLIAVYISNDKAQFALELYVGMQTEGFFPDKVTFVSILRVCAALALLLEGKKLHAIIARKGFQRDVILDTALLDLYGKCNSLKEAQEIFDEMVDRNTVSWTALVSAYAQHGELGNVVRLYKQMHQVCFLEDKVMLVSILDACACEEGLRQGKLVHACIVGSTLESEVVVGTALVNMYGKCGNLMRARKMFEIIQEPNDYSWNTMFSAYIDWGQVKEALELLGLMQQLKMVTHELTIVNILRLCANQGAIAEGQLVHSYLVSDSLELGIVQMALVEMYANWKSLCDALCVFSRIPECTTAVWNSIIGACFDNGQESHGIHFFEQMLQECSLPNRETFVNILDAFPKPSASLVAKHMYYRIVFSAYNLDDLIEYSIIDEYCKGSSLAKAWSVFDGLPIRTVISWNSIINAAFTDGNFVNGIQLFFQLQMEGILPDKIIFLTVLEACTSESVLARGKQLHMLCVGTNCDRDASVGTALTNLYGRCGNLTQSQKVFEELPQRNLFTWTCMITVLAQYGQGASAILLFDQMQRAGIVPDKVTFTSILCACARAGMTHMGCWLLLHMNNFCGIFPAADHFNCICDLLGKAGQMDEVELFVKNMPLQPTVASWTVVLDACKLLSDVSHAEDYAEQVLEMDAEDAALFVTLSSVYVAAFEDVSAALT